MPSFLKDKDMEAIIDSSVILDSLECLSSYRDRRKNQDRCAIEKIIQLKKKNRIVCVRIINLEFETAKDSRQLEIDQKWGNFDIRQGIALKAGGQFEKIYDPSWDIRFDNLNKGSDRHYIDNSMIVSSEYYNIEYIVSTDYSLIKKYRNIHIATNIVRPVDFMTIIYKRDGFLRGMMGAVLFFMYLRSCVMVEMLGGFGRKLFKMRRLQRRA